MEKTVTFNAVDNGVLDTMSVLDKRSRDVMRSMAEWAQKSSNSGKEQLRLINEQITALERKNRVEFGETKQASNFARQERIDQVRKETEGLLPEQRQRLIENETRKADQEYSESLENAREELEENRLQTQLLRQQIDVLRQTSKNEVNAYGENTEELEARIKELEESESPTDRLQSTLMREEAEKRRKEKEKEEQESSKDDEKKESTYSALARYGLLEKAISQARQVAASENGIDTVSSLSSTISSTMGAGLGLLLKSNPIGLLFSGLADVVTDLLLRSVTTQQEVMASKYRTRALGGLDVPTSDLSQAGFDYTQVAQVAAEVVQKTGRARGASDITDSVMLLERGFGINRNISMELLELRQNQDIVNIAGGLLKRGQEEGLFTGGDRGFLPEFMQKFASLEKELLRTNTSVNSGLTANTMLAISGLGGMFNLRDPRSMGMIQSLNTGLSAPGSDAAKGFLYSTLRELFPTEGIYDTKVRMSQGLGTPGYLKKVMENLEGFGGDDQLKMFLYEGMFQGLPPDAIRTLVQNRSKILSGEISDKQLESIITPGGLKDEAAQNTTELEKWTAEIKNAFVAGSVAGIKEIGEKVAAAVALTLQGSQIEMVNGRMIVPRSNKVIKPSEGVIDDIFNTVKDIFK